MAAAPDLPDRINHEISMRIEHEMLVASERFRSRITKLVIASVVLDLVTAGMAMLLEDGAPHAFANYFDALFWTTTQLLTVSSQLPNPERAATKILDVVLEVWAIVVVASLAATFSDLLHHRTTHRAMRLRKAASSSADVR